MKVCCVSLYVCIVVYMYMCVVCVSVCLHEWCMYVSVSVCVYICVCAEKRVKVVKGRKFLQSI